MTKSWLDAGIKVFDTSLKTFLQVHQANRPYPVQELIEPVLTAAQKKQAAALMRVNHAGEIAAQALYEGQQLTARNQLTKTTMQTAAYEEIDHLVWCEQRLRELNSHTSYLAPVWFYGAFIIGTLAGIAGDKWSLGFLAETEKQVVEHLEKHLELLPLTDHKSRDIVKQMQRDESAHATIAQTQGGEPLPKWVKNIMRLSAKFMTTTAQVL